MGISQYITVAKEKKQSKTRHKELLKKFTHLSEGKSKRKVRKMEMALLRPEPLPEYSGPKAEITNFKKRSILFSFSSPKAVKMIARIIKVAWFKGNNTHDTLMVEELFNLINQDKVKWYKQRKQFRVRVKGGKWKWI